MTILTVVLAAVISLAPSLLPRASFVQGAVTGVTIVVALLTVRFVVAVLRRSGRAPRSGPAELRLPEAFVGAAVVQLLLDHPALRDLVTVRLRTRDAQAFYERLGGESGARAASDPGKFIGRRDDDRPLEGERAA